MLTTSQKDSVKIVFLHCLSTIVLILCLWSITSLSLQYLNLSSWLDWRGFDFTITTMRWDLASLIVSFPTLTIISLYLAKENRTEEYSQIKTIFSYFIFLITSLIILYEIIQIFYHLLNNELSVNFFMQVTLSCFIAIFIAYYYFILNSHQSPIYILCLSFITTVAVALIIGYGIYTIKIKEKLQNTLLTYAINYRKPAPAIIPVKKLSMPATPIPYCSGRSLPVSKEEDEVIQKLLVRFMSKTHCEIGTNCLLKWNGIDTVNFHTAWKMCGYGPGSTFRCATINNNFCCSYENEDEKVCID